MEQTASVIPTDLVNNMLREPYRERLRLIIAELGTGLAGRPEDLPETIERAHPGLRETNETLAILEAQNDVIGNFVTDSDDAHRRPRGESADVVRFVQEAGETAEITATRREELAEQFERLPAFLAELDPTMVRSASWPTRRPRCWPTSRARPGSSTRSSHEAGPVLRGVAARPSSSLGETARSGTRAFATGRQEIRRAAPLASARFGEPLRQFLQTIDDRARDRGRPAREGDRAAREPRSRPPSPGRGGFTGLEAIWNYLYWQTLSINMLDDVGHILRAALTVAPDCSNGDCNEPPKTPEDRRCSSAATPTSGRTSRASSPDPLDDGGTRRLGAAEPRGGKPASASASSAARGSPRPAAARPARPLRAAAGHAAVDPESLLDSLTPRRRSLVGLAATRATSPSTPARRSSTRVTAPRRPPLDGSLSSQLLDFLLAP